MTPVYEIEGDVRKRCLEQGVAPPRAGVSVYPLYIRGLEMLLGEIHRLGVLFDSRDVPRKRRELECTKSGTKSDLQHTCVREMRRDGLVEIHLRTHEVPETSPKNVSHRPSAHYSLETTSRP